jgi:gliding motility-associated-like protein
MTGGTFSYAVASGGPTLDINTTMGAINLATSSVGAYDITYNTAGAGASLCPNSSTLQLVITNAPEANFSLGVYCANETDPLPDYINDDFGTPFATSGSGGTFSSTPAGLVINPNTGEVDLSASTPGITYTVTNDINVAGCALATATDDILIHELPDATISGGVNICSGQPLPDLTVTATSGLGDWTINYEHDGTALQTSTSGSNTATIASASVGTYELVDITDANGCYVLINGQAIVGEFPTPVMDPLADQEVCAGDALTATMFTSTPQANQFDWSNLGTDLGFGMSGINDIGTFTAINGTGSSITSTIEVTPTSLEGCVGLPTTFDITVNPIPVVAFTPDSYNGCEPYLVNFTNDSNPIGSNCVWTFGDGTTINSCGPISHEYLAGTYQVSLEVTTAEGCTDSYTDANSIIVDIVPEALFSYAPQEITIDNPIVEFTNSSINASTYEWDFDDDSPLSIVEHPLHQFPEEPGEYLITLWAYNGVCVDSIQQLIEVKDVLIFYVPNVMTPDGDQFNESFQPVFTSGFDPFNFHMTIFNRWGEVIFESFDATKGWNGHYGDGGLVDDGVYIWQIEFKETMSDKRHKHRGHVTVLK